MSRLQLIGDTCLREFPKNWAQTSLPQVLGKLLLLHCGWLHEADFAWTLVINDLEARGDFLFTCVISKGKKNSLQYTPRLKSVFPVEGGNVGKWLFWNKTACLPSKEQRNPGSKSKFTEKLMTWFYKIRNFGILNTSLQRCEGQKE